jgi:hypothetical protein
MAPGAGHRRPEAGVTVAATIQRVDVQACAVAGAAALVWLVLGPRTPDLAAQSYRVGLFAREGFALWDNGWFAGHHVPAYSLLFPPLGAAIGMRVAGALAAVLAAFCFARVAERRFGARARAGILWFAAATATDLAIGRLTYALGAALALAAIWAAGRWLPAAAVAAALAAAATPLAGLFLGLAGAALLLTGRRRGGLALALPALAVAVAMVALFPEGGSQPFHRQALVTSVVLTVAFACLVRDRLLRVAAGLYLVGTLAAAVLSTPIGGNTTRLGAVFAGPLLLCSRPRGGRIVAVALAGMLAWQWFAPVREVSNAAGDRLSQPATYRGLLAFLAADDPPGGRIEIPFTRSHWETAIVAPRFPLARGWEKQLDVAYDGLFYAPGLTAATYHAWLRRLGVRYVAVPAAPLDPSSAAEARLIDGGLPYLRAVYRDRDWQVWRLADPLPLASAPARLVALGGQSFTLAFARAGTSLVRVRWSRYWRTDSGCTSPAAAGFTQVGVDRKSTVRVAIDFALGGRPAC